MLLYGQVLHLIHSGAELGEGMLMDSFRLQSIGQYCPSIRDINLCDTPFCENDVQVCGLFPVSFFLSFFRSFFLSLHSWTFCRGVWW